MIIKKTTEFQRWYATLGEIDQTKIDARLDHMQDGIFSNSRSLSDSLFELKWKNGMRVYYSRRKISGADVIMLWGGFKGTQKNDIMKARRIQERYENAFKSDGQ